MVCRKNQDFTKEPAQPFLFCLCTLEDTNSCPPPHGRGVFFYDQPGLDNKRYEAGGETGCIKGTLSKSAR